MLSPAVFRVKDAEVEDLLDEAFLVEGAQRPDVGGLRDPIALQHMLQMP